MTREEKMRMKQESRRALFEVLRERKFERGLERALSQGRGGQAMGWLEWRDLPGRDEEDMAVFRRELERRQWKEEW